MYEDYKQARNAAWKTLIDCKITSLPVDLTKIAEHYGFRVAPYSRLPLLQVFSPKATSGDGFITQIEDMVVIFLNDKVRVKGRRRFTLAHEIGHGVLEQPFGSIRTRHNEVDDDSDPIETMCNVFARDILAPAGVLARLGVHTPEEIMRLCGLSRQSAEIRAERLRLLYERGVFGIHPLERQVIAQFEEFIDANKLT